MRTLAQTLIKTRYVDHGKTTRFVVLPLPDSGLPPQLVKAGQPVPLDLLAGRPVNLELDEEGLCADLCFAGPPVRCRFPWEGIIAVQDAAGELVQTMVVTVATVMEDHSLKTAAPEHLTGFTPHHGPEEPAKDAPPIAIINGGRGTEARPRAVVGQDGKARPRLELITDNGPKGPPPH